MPVKYWEIIADNLHRAGWSYGYVSAIDSKGRTIWIVDGHRDDGKRYVARVDDILTAFLELESALPRKSQTSWKTIDENLSKAGWTRGCVVSMDAKGRDIFVVVAQRNGKRVLVRTDEQLAAYREIERATNALRKP